MYFESGMFFLSSIVEGIMVLSLEILDVKVRHLNMSTICNATVSHFIWGLSVPTCLF